MFKVYIRRALVRLIVPYDLALYLGQSGLDDGGPWPGNVSCFAFLFVILNLYTPLMCVYTLITNQGVFD